MEMVINLEPCISGDSFLFSGNRQTHGSWLTKMGRQGPRPSSFVQFVENSAHSAIAIRLKGFHKVSYHAEV